MIYSWHRKRVKKISFGPELITDAGDRDFSAGQGNWIIVTGTEITWDNVDMDFACTEFNAVRLAVVVNEGTLYRFQFDITAYTVGHMSIYVGGSDAVQIPGEAIGTFVLYVLAAAGDYIQIGGLTGFIGSIDNVSLKKVL